MHGEEVGATDVSRALDVDTSLQRGGRGGGTARPEDDAATKGLEDSLGLRHAARSVQRDLKRTQGPDWASKFSSPCRRHGWGQTTNECPSGQSVERSGAHAPANLCEPLVDLGLPELPAASEVFGVPKFPASPLVAHTALEFFCPEQKPTEVSRHRRQVGRGVGCDAEHRADEPVDVGRRPLFDLRHRLHGSYHRQGLRKGVFAEVEGVLVVRVGRPSGKRG